MDHISDLKTSYSFYSFALDSRELTIGSSEDNELTLKAFGISAEQALIKLDPVKPTIRDLSGKESTKVNGRVIEEEVLQDGVILTLGVSKYNVAILEDQLVLSKVEGLSTPVKMDSKILSNNDTITIGRSRDNTLILSHPLISRNHCTVEKIGEVFKITDHNSTNGTYINGKEVHHKELKESDLIQVGPYRFIIERGEFKQADDARSVKLDAHNLNLSVKGRKILDNLSISIPAGEFVAILGPSGAGKTTLAKALCGLISIDSGTILFNNFSLTKLGGAISATVGYVSQDNLLRPELSALETLSEQAILRFPRDSIEAERTERINEVMQMLDIAHLAHSRISMLSGGEAKRVHLGIELLASPTIIFLDEPLAGLDPGLINKFMELFKMLSKNGHTVLLTTHTLEQLSLCDRILFLNQGNLVFQGNPEQSEKFFDVESIAEAYEKVRKGEVKFHQFDELVDTDDGYLNKPEQNSKVKVQKRKAGIIRQYFMLTSRYLRILMRDISNLGLLLAQAPLIAFLLSLVFHPDTKFLPLSFYFCVSISAIWTGGVNTAREISKEWSLFDREYRSGLSLRAYVCSKNSVAAILAIVQAALLTGSLSLLFDGFKFTLPHFLIIAVASLSGSILGLTISSFAGNVNRAVSLLPIIFIPQIFFSGILIPFDQMPDAGTLISHVTIARPVFSMFKKVSVLELPASEVKEWISLVYLNVALIILMSIRIRFYKFFNGSKKS